MSTPGQRLEDIRMKLMSSSGLLLEDLRIPLDEIRSATKDFSVETLIAVYDLFNLYIVHKGQFTERLQRNFAVKWFRDEYDQLFFNELKVISRFHHENIISFIGYCDEGDKKIIVYKYPINGTLHNYLMDPKKLLSLTWPQRLKICLGAAKAINYLHFGLSEDCVVIHRNFNSSAIFLDDNLEAKISRFEYSIVGDRNQQHIYASAEGRDYCTDPIYRESGILKKEADVYSFGVVMFELLTGAVAYNDMKIGDDKPLPMINLVRRYNNIDGLDTLIDPKIRDQTDRRSLDSFIETAYRCISYNLNDRPSMDRIVKRITEALDIHNHAAASTITIRSHLHQNLEIPLIPLKEIRLATGNFSRESHIGDSRVYKGQLSGRWENRTAAFKRHHLKKKQGEAKFRNELQIMSSLRHENIIQLIGYCDEKGEMTIIYDYAVNGSLDSDFSPENRIVDSGFGYVYRGQLSGRWKNRTAAFKLYLEAKFRNELQILSSLRHENIIQLIGYCDEGHEKIIIYDYAVNGTLESHLKDESQRRCLTWAKRLKICIGAAKGLENLQASHGEDKIRAHRNFNSKKILLDDNMEPLISGLGFSIVVDRNKGQVYDKPYTNYNYHYTDPIYQESGIIKSETDVYSLGVILFEMLSGKLANYTMEIEDVEGQHYLINLVRRLSYDDGVVKLIDPLIKDQIDIHSFLIFKEIASKCISLNFKDRPSLNRIIKRLEEALRVQEQVDSSTIAKRSLLSHQDKKLEDFRIPLEEIRKATDFSKRSEIGNGGFGVVYKGQSSKIWQNCPLAIKCRKYRQGKYEFQNELDKMFRFHHHNIINFIGYCDEGNEMIIVNEYASNGSLETYLEKVQDKRRSLTWEQRLRICIGVARGLDHLHWGLGENNRVIHRDVKSANILLDDNLEAKICDFGLSRSGPTDKPRSKLYTKAAGTRFYVDPLYRESGILQKESDVYSLGVVLFEMLTGILASDETAIEKGEELQYLINLVRRYFDDGLDMLVDPSIKDEMDRRSFHTFKHVAYACISLNSKDRPTMDTIIDRLEEALEFQLGENLGPSREQLEPEATAKVTGD